jgi:hypothetical protein
MGTNNTATRAHDSTTKTGAILSLLKCVYRERKEERAHEQAESNIFLPVPDNVCDNKSEKLQKEQDSCGRNSARVRHSRAASKIKIIGSASRTWRNRGAAVVVVTEGERVA